MDVPRDPYARSDEEWEIVDAARAELFEEFFNPVSSGNPWHIRKELNAYCSRRHMNIKLYSHRTHYYATTDQKTIHLLGRILMHTLTLRGHTAWVSCLAFDQEEERRMLSGQWGGNCRLWSHGKLVRELPGGRATAIAFHPDRKHYLIFADGNLYQGILVPDLTKSLPADSSPEGAQGPRVTILQPAEPVSFEVPENLCLINAWALAVRPDGKRVVTGHEDGLLVEWDLQTRKIVSYYKSKLGEILDVAYMSNGLTTSKGVKFTGARDEKTPYYWAPGEKKHTLRMPRWLQPVLLETPVVEQPKAE